MIQSWMDYPLGNSHIPSKIMFEDDVPFDQVGYVNSLEGIYIYLKHPATSVDFIQFISETVTSTRLHQPKATKKTPLDHWPNNLWQVNLTRPTCTPPVTSSLVKGLLTVGFPEEGLIKPLFSEGVTIKSSTRCVLGYRGGKNDCAISWRYGWRWWILSGFRTSF